ncbi:hypothetical protein [Streptomyces luteogriseus]|uniref:hypothetical protein n=1 Tax=Streptomyces luteogriseus TaxID=68233 RepID=UPI003721B60C
MSDTRPGADELRVQALLKQRGVGPDATPPRAPRPLPPFPPTPPVPPLPPVPQQRPRDWLDDLAEYNAPAPPAPPEQSAAPPQPVAKEPQPKGSGRARRAGRGGGPQYAPLTPSSSPRQSLLEAYDRVPPRMKWLAYHASAAYLGWSVGLVDWATYVTGWIADTGPIGPQAVFWYATAGGTVLVYRCTRRWWWPVAWLAAVPATSTVTGVLLYAPNL